MKSPLNTFVAEDEPPARERLIKALARVAPEVVVVGQAHSVQGAQAWLDSHAAPDLLLLDIQLSDGLSLELFNNGRLTLPTIFTTAYNQFAIDAFRAQAIDYLLKPVADDALAQALARVHRLRPAFGMDMAAVLQQLTSATPRWRQRLVGRKGAQFHALAVADLAYVVSVDKLAFAVDRAGERYLLETALAELETELDPRQFFRANRQLLVAASAVVRFGSAGKGRLKLELRPSLAGEMVVSQERAAAFKLWLGG